MFDPYRVLQVDPTADLEVIQAAYRALARRHHPDVSPGQASQGRMVEINAAWDVLRDPTRRAQFDRSRREAAGATWGATPTTGTSAPSPSPAAPSAASQPFTAGGHVRGPMGAGAAGPPPGRPSGSVLDFGRHKGWSLGEIARVDPGYLVWLEEKREGQPYRSEIDTILRSLGVRRDPLPPSARRRGGLFASR